MDVRANQQLGKVINIPASPRGGARANAQTVQLTHYVESDCCSDHPTDQLPQTNGKN